MATIKKLNSQMSQVTVVIPTSLLTQLYKEIPQHVGPNLDTMLELEIRRTINILEGRYNKEV